MFSTVNPTKVSYAYSLPSTPTVLFMITNPTTTNPIITNPTITHPTISNPTTPGLTLLSKTPTTHLQPILTILSTAGGVTTVLAGFFAAAVAGLDGVATTGPANIMTASTSSAAVAKTWGVNGDSEGQKVVLVPPASGGWEVWSQIQRIGVVVVAVVAVALMAVVVWVLWRVGERRRRAKERQMGWVPSDDDQRNSRRRTSMRKRLQSLKVLKSPAKKRKEESENDRTIEGLETIEVGPAARRAFWEDLTTAGEYKRWESGIAMNELGREVLKGDKPTAKQKKVWIDGVTVIDGEL